MEQTNFSVKGIIKFLRVRWLRELKLHQTSSWRPSCPCIYVVEPHPKLTMPLQVTYCPHLLCSGTGAHLTRFRKKMNPAGIAPSHHREIKCVPMQVQGTSRDAAGEGMGRGRKTRPEHLQCCYENTPLEKLLTSLLAIWDKAQSQYSIMCHNVPMCNNGTTVLFCHVKMLASRTRWSLLLLCEDWKTTKAKYNEVILLNTLVKSLVIHCMQVI